MHTLKHTTRLSSQARSVGAGTVSTPQAASLRNHGAFTLIEMLVVISIVVLVVGFTIPALSLMQSTSRSEAGYNTVSVAVEAARQLATQASADQDPISEGGSANGTAALFTNTGTVRLLEHDASVSFPAGDNENGKGYVDIPGRNYIDIPNNTGIVGIRRNRNGTAAKPYRGLELIAPPFALRFNRHGNLIFGNTDTNNGAFNVYYDGDYDGNYEETTTRGSSYQPNSDPARNYNAAKGKWEVPFEEIETVVGVIVFDAGDIENLTPTALENFNADGTGRRIVDTGRAVFFSRYTGAPMRGIAGPPSGQ